MFSSTVMRLVMILSSFKGCKSQRKRNSAKKVQFHFPTNTANGYTVIQM